MKAYCTLLAASLLLFSCVSAPGPVRITYLTGSEKLLEGEAVLALRLVIDAPNDRLAAVRSQAMTGAPYPVLHLVAIDGNTYRPLNLTQKMGPADWQRIGERYRYVKDIIIKVPLGSYSLRALELYMGRSSGQSGPSEVTTTTYYLMQYLNTGFTLAESRVYALGEIVWFIDSLEGDSLRSFKFAGHTVIDHGPDAAQRLQESTEKLSPSLLSRGGGPVSLALRYQYSLLAPQYYDNLFSGDRLWHWEQSERLEAGRFFNQFEFRKKVKDGAIDFLRPSYAVDPPENYDISWEARLEKGQSDESFGLMVGRDEKNCHLFSTTGAGIVAIRQIAKNVWQKDIIADGAPSAHSTESGEYNRYLLQVRGQHGAFSVNGARVSDMDFPYSLSRPFLALFLQSPGTFQIRSFFVTGMP